MEEQPLRKCVTGQGSRRRPSCCGGSVRCFLRRGGCGSAVAGDRKRSGSSWRATRPGRRSLTKTPMGAVGAVVHGRVSAQFHEFHEILQRSHRPALGHEGIGRRAESPAAGAARLSRRGRHAGPCCILVRGRLVGLRLRIHGFRPDQRRRDHLRETCRGDGGNLSDFVVPALRRLWRSLSRMAGSCLGYRSVSSRYFSSRHTQACRLSGSTSQSLRSCCGYGAHGKFIVRWAAGIPFHCYSSLRSL